MNRTLTGATHWTQKHTMSLETHKEEEISHALETTTEAFGKAAARLASITPDTSALMSLPKVLPDTPEALSVILPVLAYEPGPSTDPSRVASLRTVRSLPALPQSPTPVTTSMTTTLDIPKMWESPLNEITRNHEIFRSNLKNYLHLDKILAATEEAANAMYSTRMKGRLFDDWYQEWSIYAAHAGVDENTKMYAFRRNLNQAIHTKILGVSPQPTTLAELVKLAKAFDQAYLEYRSNTVKSEGLRYPSNSDATMKSDDSMQINRYTGREHFKKISKEEKDRRFRMKLCLYCASIEHLVKECPVKQNAQNALRAGQNPRRDIEARATTTQESKYSGESPAPVYEEFPPSATISRLYQDPDPFGLLRPRSAPINEDF